MYYKILSMVFDVLDDNGNAVEVSDEYLEKIKNYVLRTLWEVDDPVNLNLKIESLTNWKIHELDFTPAQPPL